ncbi:MAG: cytochrome c oxidase assembly protein [Rickettsiales bacterium]|nr:cytochrome c oxidase assembly protein [Rickettsiales bacterium]
MSLRRKNLTLAVNLFLLVAGMLGLAYASVPLYRLFCEMTGFGGATRTAIHAPAPNPTQAEKRIFTIRFNADTDPTLPWRFAPGQLEMPVHVGAQSLTHYTAENLTDSPITGHATYNVVPNAAGPYFTKIECFCFKEQTLAPHQKVDMPVLFFIDPAVMQDPDMKDVKTITLSYTFFPVKNDVIKP